MSTLPLLLALLACKGPLPDDSAGDDTGPAEDTGPCTGVDADGDGYDDCSDCDDGDRDVHPGAPERCNGIDDDCDGAPDPGEQDTDDDGVPDCRACDDAGFWSTTRGLEGAALRDALFDTLDDTFRDCDYDSARRFMFVELDKQGGQVECVYTGKRVNVGTSEPNANVMNTEHTWPRSKGAENEPEECDLHHLFPTDSDANSRRGSHPLDVVTGGTDWSNGGSRIGQGPGGDTVFEPRDAHKGDAARALLYFAVRWPQASAGAMNDFFHPHVDRYLAWHAADPPDAREIARSERIGQVQGSPNPFVVCPELAERAW